MTLKTVLLTALLFLSGYVVADESTDKTSLRYETGILGSKYFLDEMAIGRAKLKSHISSNTEALDVFNQSNFPYYGALGLAVVGGAAIGSSFGNAQANDESVNASAIGGGFALIGLAFVVMRSAEKYMGKSVDLFNAANVSLKPVASRYRKVSSSIYVTHSQVGISLSF